MLGILLAILYAIGRYLREQYLEDIRDKCPDDLAPFIWCGDAKFDFIIDGECVRLGPKVFSKAEIERLKIRDEESGESTYEIFEDIDEKTRSCEFELANFRTFQGEGLQPSIFYRGSLLNGVKHGIGIYESS